MDSNLGPDELTLRYGTRGYYEDFFKGIQHPDLRKYYILLASSPPHSDDHETARQTFLKSIGQPGMIWRPTAGLDKDVYLTRIYREENQEYLAIMRIKPQGYRIERRVPPDSRLKFHLLYGRVTLKKDKRTRVLTRGNSATMGPSSLYAFKNNCHDQDAYLVFELTITQADRSQSQMMQGTQAMLAIIEPSDLNQPSTSGASW